MPLTTEEILKTIENSESTFMFEFKYNYNENILRNSSRFAKLMDRHPPIYLTDLTPEIRRSEKRELKKGSILF
jgi:hypothetical protein